MKALNRVLQMSSHFYVSGALALLSYVILYVDLSGYSDIAIAVGSFMGIPVPENFKQPWTAASFTQFWRKWHVTLSDFIREHIFVVVSGKRLSKWISALIGLITMLVMSLWHEFSLLSLCTGFYMGAVLAWRTCWASPPWIKGGRPRPSMSSAAWWSSACSPSTPCSSP